MTATGVPVEVSDEGIDGEHLPIPLLCGLPYAFEGIVFREDAEEVAEYWRSASCRGASQKRVLKFLELHESHILRVRAGLDEVAAGYDGPSVVCPHHRVLRRQTGEGVDVRAEVERTADMSSQLELYPHNQIAYDKLCDMESV